MVFFFRFKNSTFSLNRPSWEWELFVVYFNSTTFSSFWFVMFDFYVFYLLCFFGSFVLFDIAFLLVFAENCWACAVNHNAKLKMLMCAIACKAAIFLISWSVCFEIFSSVDKHGSESYQRSTQRRYFGKLHFYATSSSDQTYMYFYFFAVA